ncbi:MAG: glycosyltransferase involved in cell wall biosynthesis [Planctomycetota bacterium]|jgi:glycosyltransferase involved in cell wall biosynthesis
MSLKIGIDATCWANGRGYGRYTRELVTALVSDDSPHQFYLFIEAENAGLLDHLAERVTVVAVPLSEAPSEAAAAESSRSPVDMIRLRRAVAKEKVDVLFFPTVYSWFPIKKSQKVLLTIHDAIAERFPELCFGNWRAQLFWNLKVKAAIRQATLFLTTSDYGRNDLTTILGVNDAKIRKSPIVPAKIFHPRPQEETDAIAQELGLTSDDSWFIYVGGFNPHKNVHHLIRAFAASKERLDHDAKLLLVGTVDKDNFFGDQAALRTLIQELRVSDDVLWTGFVDDDKLAALFSKAVAVALPSSCEGFGLPAVEAASCGAPVIVTKESPMPQILEGGGIFVVPAQTEPLADALVSMLNDPDARAQMAKVAYEKVQALTWGRAVSELTDYLEEAAK